MFIAAAALHVGRYIRWVRMCDKDLPIHYQCCMYTLPSLSTYVRMYLSRDQILYSSGTFTRLHSAYGTIIYLAAELSPPDL